jgi:hypothetical protein
VYSAVYPCTCLKYLRVPKIFGQEHLGLSEVSSQMCRMFFVSAVHPFWINVLVCLISCAECGSMGKNSSFSWCKRDGFCLLALISNPQASCLSYLPQLQPFTQAIQL